MKKLLFSILLIFSLNLGWAQFEPTKYICKNPNGITETLWIEPQPPNTQGENQVHFFYQSSQQKTRTQLIYVPRATQATFHVKFPNDPKIYALRYGKQMGELICTNPDGSEQTFLIAIDDKDFTTYISNNQGVTEKLYINYSFVVGAWNVIEYSSSNNSQRIRLRIVEAGEVCKVQFPNDSKIYSLVLNLDQMNPDIDASHFIIPKFNFGVLF
jgi:hypothetical protein